MKPRKTRPLLERLIEKIHINEVTECWEWTASLQAQGYAQIMTKTEDGRNQPQLAHILTYEWLVGPAPEGMELDHLCRRRFCVNPWHLEAVPHIENVARGESPTMKWSIQNICKKGHPLTGENIYRDPRHPESRECRLCRNNRSKQFYKDNPEYNRRWRKMQSDIRNHH